jgi:hypothetical protein
MSEHSLWRAGWVTQEVERILLGHLSRTLERFEAGNVSERDVERAREGVRRFYRRIGMHP